MSHNEAKNPEQLHNILNDTLIVINEGAATRYNESRTFTRKYTSCKKYLNKQ